MLRTAIVALSIVLISEATLADCINRPEGAIVSITPEKCRFVDSAKHSEVLKYGDRDRYVNGNRETWNYKEAYTGDLITDKTGQRWMYSSSASDPCKRFALNQPVKMRAYYTCCDTGRWGKCVFGGAWLGDVYGKRINAFQ